MELRELREFLRSSWCSGGKAGVSLTLFAGEFLDALAPSRAFNARKRTIVLGPCGIVFNSFYSFYSFYSKLINVFFVELRELRELSLTLFAGEFLDALAPSRAFNARKRTIVWGPCGIVFNSFNSFYSFYSKLINLVCYPVSRGGLWRAS